MANLGTTTIYGDLTITGALNTTENTPTFNGGVITEPLTTSATTFDNRITTGNKQIFNAGSNIIYVGNPSTMLQLESSTNPIISVGLKTHYLYHEGYKPTPATIGAATTIHSHTEYATTSHSHSNYAATAHVHSNYSATGHVHTAAEISDLSTLNGGNADTVDGVHLYPQNSAPLDSTPTPYVYAFKGGDDFNCYVKHLGDVTVGNANNLGGLPPYQMATLSQAGTSHGLSHYLTAQYNIKGDARFYIKTTSNECRVDYATSAGNSDTVGGVSYNNLARQYTVTNGVTIADTNIKQFYGTCVTANASAPTTDWWHIINVPHGDNNGYGGQLAIGYHGTASLYVRSAGGTAWGSWYDVIGNIESLKSTVVSGKTSVANAINGLAYSKLTNQSSFAEMAATVNKLPKQITLVRRVYNVTPGNPVSTNARFFIVKSNNKTYSNGVLYGYFNVKTGGYVMRTDVYASTSWDLYRYVSAGEEKTDKYHSFIIYNPAKELCTFTSTNGNTCTVTVLFE